ncbi:hypothetical protein CO610_02265 [Lysobacteraceae bacterium NML95-0200]|nr:hypothetical protein CO610_02265 [Xanthomonadaceae bacterium NML95-0200]
MNMTAVLVPACLLVACAAPQKQESTTPPHWAVQRDTAMPSSPKPLPPELRPVLPGTPVPGSRISVPRTVKAGEALEGRVPVGSQVTVNGQAVAVDENGQFSYPVEKSANGSLDVRIKRPAPDTRPAMPLRVQIVR